MARTRGTEDISFEVPAYIRKDTRCLWARKEERIFGEQGYIGFREKLCSLIDSPSPTPSDLPEPEHIVEDENNTGYNIFEASEQKNPSDGHAMEVPPTSSRRLVSGRGKSVTSIGLGENGKRTSEPEEEYDLEEDKIYNDKSEDFEAPPIPNQSPSPHNRNYRPRILSKSELEASMLARTVSRKPTNATTPDSPRFPLTKVGYISPPGASPTRTSPTRTKMVFAGVEIASPRKYRRRASSKICTDTP
ncbi:unnamed protein product [Rhizoctonia solani]|uniref:Uncharacterized protein n=1 Tax=Rhizoctonia solani TaxID=456999 RepID=A0A8H3ADQ2_9AGAM|nr:unnamed protein product [Rhizoctonia solani]